MAQATLDLDGYCERVGWRGPRTPTYGTLAGLLLAHARAIPFENLDVLLGRRIRLDLAGLQEKLVAARRGGYCFEHATLFAAVLDALGFAPVRHAARVILQTPREASPQSHMFLTVSLPEGTFVVDPGFGSLAARVPVPLAEDRRAEVGGEAHWMVRDAYGWVLHARRGRDDVACWVTTLAPQHAIDFEVGNHWTATHPDSPFRSRLAMRALTDDGRITVLNRQLTVWRGGEPLHTELPDRAALREAVARHFGFDLPEIDSLHVPAVAEWA